MSIPVSTVVNVSVSVGAQFPQRAGFGTLNIVTSETGVIGLSERIRYYANIDGVVNDWPANSEVVKAATSYFGQQPKPTKLAVSVRFDLDQAAELRGGSVEDTAANVATFVAIADGSFSITLDGVPYEITGVDFSGETTLEEVAAAIGAAIQLEVGAPIASSCTYDGFRFFITLGTDGVASTVSFLTPAGSGTYLGELLQFRQDDATKSDGIDAETITASLNTINLVNDNWYGLSFTREIRDGVIVNGENAVVAATSWANARVKVFFNTTNDLDVLDSVTTNDVASVLKLANYRRVLSTFSRFSGQYPSASIAGRVFTVNFSQQNSTITAKFKQLPGINTENLSVNDKAVLGSKNCNALIDVGGNSMYAESFMANGSFFDELHGLDWLTNAIQTNVFGYLLTRTTKVPYTDKGRMAIVQQVIKALDEAVFNGLIAAGTTIEGEFLPLGYKVVSTPVAEVNQSDKEARQYNGISATILGAGAIHGVQVNVTFER